MKSDREFRTERTVIVESKTTMSGYTIVEAQSMEAALEAAKSCPFLDINGTLEVSELLEIKGK